MENMTIFDYLDSLKPPTKQKLNIGDKIYRIVLDVVETGIIDTCWNCGDEFGYSTKRDAGIVPITCWDRDVGDIVFTNKEKAYTKAESLKKSFKVVRAKDMEIIKERNFIEVCDDSRICISASVKLLKNNAVYYSDWMCYPFLEFCETEKEADEKYNEKLDKIMQRLVGNRRFEVNIRKETKDMYLCKDGKWSEYRYVNHNGAVLL